MVEMFGFKLVNRLIHELKSVHIPCIDLIIMYNAYALNPFVTDLVLIYLKLYSLKWLMLSIGISENEVNGSHMRMNR